MPPHRSDPSQFLFLICMTLNEPIVGSPPEQRSPQVDSCQVDSITATARRRSSSMPQRRKAVGRFDHRPRRAEGVCPVTAAPAIFGAARLWGGRVLPAREVPAKSTRARNSTPLIEPDRFIELAGTYIVRG